MKRLAILLTLCLSAHFTQAQSYYYVQTAGSDSAFDHLYGFATVIMSEPANDVMSPVQALPFAWDFFGQPVTHYRASDNGYITFDTTSTQSWSNNTSIPDPSGPNNAIYAFWDNLEMVAGSGATDEIHTWTYGTTPNRVHVVEWFSVTPYQQNGTAFMYAAILMYEGGDFDIVLPYSFDCGGLMSATIGAEDATGANGLEVTGSPTIDYQDNDQSKGDDISYNFIWGTQPQHDALLQIDNLPPAYTMVPVKHARFDIYDIKVTNTGQKPLTGVKIKTEVDVNMGNTYHDSLILGSIAKGAIIENHFETSYIPTDSSNLDLTVEVWHNDPDADSSDNMVAKANITWNVNDTVYAKDEGFPQNGVGFNADGGSIGNDFILQQDDTLMEVMFQSTSFNTGDSFSVSVYHWLGDTAGAHVYTSPVEFFDGSEYYAWRYVDMDSLALSAGHYAIVMDQLNLSSNMSLAHGGPTGYGIGKGNSGWFISSTFNTPFVRAKFAPINTNMPSIISQSVKDIKCNGEMNGSITINVIGGTKPYSFLWSNTDTTQNLNNIGAGTYSVIITDSNNNKIYDTMTVVEPNALVSSISGTVDESCGGYSDGSIDLSVNGGTPPISFGWSNNEITEDLSGIGAGHYVVTITDQNGCSAFDSTDITGPPIINLTLTHTDIDCYDNNNGTGTVVASGGSGSLSVLWSTGSQMTGVNGVGPGMLSVTVTDTMGCEASDSVEVLEPSEMMGTLDHDDVSCFGDADGNAVFHATGGTPPYSFAWNGGGTDSVKSGLSGGIASITVTDANSCTLSDSTDIIEPAKLEVTTGASDEDGSGNGKAWAIVTGGTGNYTYLWNNPGQSTTDSATGLFVGTYTVTVKDENNCEATAEAFINLTGIEDQSAAGIIIYPNPVSSLLHINWTNSSSVQEIRIYNMLGSLVQFRQGTLNQAGMMNLDVSELQSGMYVMHLRGAELNYQVQFVKE